MTGNDIVDLKAAFFSGKERKSRFIQKVFTGEEQELILSGRVGVWCLWAMKEAVYKAHHQRFNLSRKFDPQIIKVTNVDAKENNLLATAEYNGFKYWGKGYNSSDYVHFTATCLPQKKIFYEIHPNEIEIKIRLRELIASKLDLEIGDLYLEKNKNSIPQLIYRNSPLNLPFSITHHGNYGAFSFQLMNY